MTRSHTLFSSSTYNQLLGAINKRNINTVKKILNSAPDKKSLVNGVVPGTERTILGYIASADHFPDEKKTQNLVETLMNAGADPAVRDPGEENTTEFCNTALLDAIAAEKWKLAEFLINKYDPGIHKENYINMFSLAANAKNSPLLLALKKQVAPISVIEALLKQDADPNAQTHLFETPLHYAAYYANDKLLDLLLTYGAKPEKENIYGVNAFDIYAVRFEKESPFFRFSSRAVPAEKNGLPVFYLELDHSKPHDEKAIKDFQEIQKHAESVLQYDDLYNIRFAENSDFPPVDISIEMIGPQKAKPEWMNHRSPNKEMWNRLKPTNYDENRIQKRVDAIAEKRAQQAELIKTGKYYLYSDSQAINKLLEPMNEYILNHHIDIRDIKSYFPLFQLRFDIAACDSIYEAEKVFSAYKEVIKPEVEEEKFKQRFAAIHQERLAHLISNLEKSTVPEWNEMALLMRTNSHEPVAVRVVFIVKQLLHEYENGDESHQQFIDKLLSQIDINRREQKYIREMPIDFKPTPSSETNFAP